MKTTNRQRIITGLLVLSCATLVSAEEKKPIQQETVLNLEIPEGTLQSAVDHLEKIWSGVDKKYPINIVLQKETEDIAIDQLKLRNVTGPQAVQILAASADCELLPIYDVNAEIPEITRPIGYKLVLGLEAKQNEEIVILKQELEMLRRNNKNPQPPKSKPQKETHTIPLKNLDPNKDLDSLIKMIIDTSEWNEDDIEIAVHEPLGILIVHGTEDAFLSILMAVTNAQSQKTYINGPPQRPSEVKR